MPDDEFATAAEKRLHAALRPAPERAAAVARRALVPRPLSTTRRTGALIAALTVSLVIIGVIAWRASSPPKPALHIWGSGSLVVVTRDDGRRWVVDGARETPPTGQYVIVIPR